MEQQCRYCGTTGSGKYCKDCGQAFTTKRLTVKGMLQEAFHFFTHLDSGFPFTLKKLATAPGKMQLEYVQGYRSRYQKPFSMFFICASFAALVFYWINITLIKYYDAGNSGEAIFFHKYWVILQIVLMPVYSFINYLFFRNATINYAEIVVYQLYKFSFLFLMIALIHLLKFIFPELQTRYIELPATVLYTVITNFNFFTTGSRFMVIIKSFVTIALSFLLASFIQDLLIKKL
ncbi:MAG: DUF3667 domain-containing protein [Rhizobacter sp.]|nr:DUF3667 domain-containing protein [Ferruginibacter sp.]